MSSIMLITFTAWVALPFFRSPRPSSQVLVVVVEPCGCIPGPLLPGLSALSGWPHPCSCPHLLMPKVQNPTLIFPTPLPFCYPISFSNCPSCYFMQNPGCRLSLSPPRLHPSSLPNSLGGLRPLPTSTVTVLFPDLGDPCPLPGGCPKLAAMEQHSDFLPHARSSSSLVGLVFWELLLKV